MKTKPRKKREMIEFLSNHERYYTIDLSHLNTTYARCVHPTDMGFPDEATLEKAYDFLDIPEITVLVTEEFQDFASRWNSFWTIEFNRRNKNYIILLNSDVSDFGDLHVFTSGVDVDVDYDLVVFPQLKHMSDVVWDFDQTVDRICKKIIEFVQTHEIEEHVIMVPRVIRRAVLSSKV